MLEHWGNEIIASSRLKVYMTTFIFSESVKRMTSSRATHLHYLHVLCILLMVCVLQACGKTKEPAKEEGSASSIAGFNYSIEGIQEFYVNGQWGGAISIGGGYGNVCCVVIPQKWTQGLSATVAFERTDCRGDKEKRCPERIEDLDKWPMLKLSKEVPIEPYDQPNDVQVMFLPNDEVKIYVSHFMPDHPDHPSKLGEPRPLDHPEWVR